MKRITFFTLLLGALLLSACAGKNNEQKKKLEEALRTFQETAITLPDNLLPVHCDEEISPDRSLLNRKLKMVIYVNQEGCQDCKLHGLLPLTYMFMLENRHYENFGLVMILNTSDMESTDATLAELRFRHTVFYDLDGSFEFLNPHLPPNEMFHTFLLNEENKIILVGNPVNNAKLKKLYLVEFDKTV